LRRHCRAFAITDLHRNAGLLFEVLGEQIDDLFVLRVVQRDRRGVGRRGYGCERGQRESGSAAEEAQAGAKPGMSHDPKIR
jgi:uncharacterized protein (UPF0264 family)